MRRAIAFVKALYYYIACSYKVWRARSMAVDDLIYTTANNVRVEVYPGKKKQSEHDFIVKFVEPGKRSRTPAHIHLIVEMYVKHAHSPALTLRLRDHILEMMGALTPIACFPPQLQFYKPEHVQQFKELDNVGEFSVEFLLVVVELMAIQEKTNYPQGSLTEALYESFGTKDRFSVIQKAIWRG